MSVVFPLHFNVRMGRVMKEMGMRKGRMEGKFSEEEKEIV